MHDYSIDNSTSAWEFFVRTSFAIAIGSTLIGIYLLPGALVVKGYFLISSLFLVFSTITLSKSVRDSHEARRLHNRIDEARTPKMFRELDAE